jgi:hypothetical protein
VVQEPVEDGRGAGHVALPDRLTHRCQIFQMNRPSHRFRESAGAKKPGKKPTTEPAAAQPENQPVD